MVDEENFLKQREGLLETTLSITRTKPLLLGSAYPPMRDHGESSHPSEP